MIGFHRLAALTLALVMAAGSAWGASIVDLAPLLRGDGVVVSYRVDGAFDEEIARDIETGMEVRFRYTVELKRVRSLWLDERLSRRVIETTVAYDNLTNRYRLARSIDGEIDETGIVSDVAAMQRFMTTFESLRLFDRAGMQPNEEYYLRARGTMKERNVLLLVPWDRGTGWSEARFTYLP